MVRIINQIKATCINTIDIFKCVNCVGSPAMSFTPMVSMTFKTFPKIITIP